ncbi:2'-deoxycytidine 5'-triphosphate deaminase [Marivibrio halodurans]|uniref:2'-deoxycytidine 5'-triphosphate deaminase n=1 Tax=Marivibrio halodurans TaxID=2039722 RepID=A0A8J7S381_9PROT|nr:2'-deoxycytidine 5'-triphosphate deaminase [Marivibrio halodurans]MBP5857894.1 2'-deoxycytidine 5'-triphosphate deaminase [Marivibrio halodurans]
MPALGEGPDRQSGILPAQLVKAAIELGDIRAERRIDEAQIQPASLDLRLGAVAYRVPASFLPGPTKTVAEKLEQFALDRIALNGDEGAVLERGSVYLVPLQEGLRLRSRWSGSANPKSSTGRLDVFARVITDHATEFDAIRERYCGPLWLEIAPRSFHVRVREGSRLAQVRLRIGRPRTSDSFIRDLNERARLVHAGEDEEAGAGEGADIKHGAIALSVDLASAGADNIVGYRAKRAEDPIDVDRVGAYDPDDFWEPVHKPDGGGIVLDTDDFYILASKERVAIPQDYAADMVAYDTLVGEFRVHYAGFFDPGFGYEGERPVGAKIVLEVRSHEVPFLIDHGQIMGRVLFERLSQPTDRPYGSGIGSNYQGQALALSKQFRR